MPTLPFCFTKSWLSFKLLDENSIRLDHASWKYQKPSFLRHPYFQIEFPDSILYFGKHSCHGPTLHKMKENSLLRGHSVRLGAAARHPPKKGSFHNELAKDRMLYSISWGIVNTYESYRETFMGRHCKPKINFGKCFHRLLVNGNEKF